MGALIRLEHRVPEGFVITLEGFRQHFPADLDGHKPTRPVMQVESIRAVQEALEAQFGENRPALAVRSSAIGEDGMAASFAGQHATYYYIDEATLPAAIVDCWMSLWSGPALAYRTEHDVTTPFGMAVIVQRMVQASRSGVCFSQTPVAACTFATNGSALIEATWGLGAALVDGRVTPDQFWVDDGELLHSRIARKRFKVAENLTYPTSERLQPVPAHQQAIACLTSSEAVDIASNALCIEQHFGCPQDIEWAYEDDALYLLQTRPITNQLAAPLVPTDGRWVLFKPIVENFHEPLSPMTVDLVERVLPNVGKFINGRYYLDIDVLAKAVPFEFEIEQLADLALFRFDGLDAKLDWRRLLPIIGIMLVGYLGVGSFWHRTSHVTSKALAKFTERVDIVRNNASVDALAALKSLLLGHHPWQPVGHYMLQVNVSAGRYFTLIGILKALLQRFAPDFDISRIGELCRSEHDTFSQEMVDDLQALAGTAGQYVAVKDAILTREPAALATAISDFESQHPFVTELQEFINRYGHRCVNEMDLNTPRWREDATPIIAMLRSYLAADGTAADAHGLHLSARDALHQQVASHAKRKLLDYLIGRTSYYIALRENSRHYYVMAFDVVRHKLKLMEQEFIYEGRLKCADDIFFLHWIEAVQLANQQLDWLDIEDRIRQRRQAWQAAARQRPPETINVPIERGEGPDALSGFCASPGYAEGIARVVLDPTLSTDLEPGDILIAPDTDPGWTPLFPTAGAVVVGIGSFLSHAGTVAREYGIPCLVDVEGCTEKILSGQRVRVYATEGFVEVVDR
ncbi:MAG: PEP-utilizing enzyme [Gammaproteobacteria bacterium]|nr:PEP-utilizing enzyme [Gammaproteobacteria bacterium]